MGRIAGERDGEGTTDARGDGLDVVRVFRARGEDEDASLASLNGWVGLELEGSTLKVVVGIGEVDEAGVGKVRVHVCVDVGVPVLVVLGGGWD